MPKCPDCGIEISAVDRQCSACGWKAGGKSEHSFKWASRVEGQWIDLQCGFNDHGARCEHHGTLSPGTTGKGPWYCRQHAWVFLGGRQ